jgi:DNA-binding transcriptional ArsR family regulator
MKTSDGITTQLIAQDGPIAFTETTSLATIFDEDANRCLLLQTDESPEQTKRILKSIADGQAGIRPDAQRVILMHHTIQRMLPCLPVVAPWLHRLADAFTCDRVEVRRAFPQLLAMIQASALLHFKQRQRDGNGAILADANDFHLARRLLSKPYSQALGGGLTDAARQFFEKLPRDEVFLVKDIAKRTQVSKSSVAKWVSELNDAGAVEIAEPGRGRQPHKWRRTGQTPEAGIVLLPSADVIFPECVGRRDAWKHHSFA